ncbi:MAG: hypothetical protein M3R41_10410, partial [Pseudomonadota bacterium]|nr:hypothetical protein [Pseudomonadota bacterium]
PHTGWTARYSTRFYKFSGGGENLIRPDLPIASTWHDYRAGRDRALDTILAMPLLAKPRRAPRPDHGATPTGDRYCHAAG